MSLVRLVDGREVDSANEDWRLECEARHVLSLAPKDRQAWLDAKEKKSLEARIQLQSVMDELEPYLKAKLILSMPEQVGRAKFRAIKRDLGDSFADKVVCYIHKIREENAAPRG